MPALRERLLSDENIYLSIYMVNSYVQNKELLSREDLEKLYRLNDVFNKDVVEETIIAVRKRIASILDNDSLFFDITVFFKPKKYENQKTIFRPLHTATLIDQIAMIAMLQILVYEIDAETNQLRLSELSRLIPSNFYGNRISCNGTELFKPWQEQYHEYTATANEMLSSYCKSSEYKYEVSLDLTNFFPTINPQIVYNYILSRLPLRLDKEDIEVIKTMLRKLLVFNLCKLTPTELSWYLRCEETSISDPNKFAYAKGLPQGLPHTYFFANLFMLVVKEQYTCVFPGEMLFYVDDSVIFTNGKAGSLDATSFEQSIKDLNQLIKEKEESLLESSLVDRIFPEDYCYEVHDFGVTVHEANSKSVFAPISEAQKNSGEMYLRSLSRETSNIGFDMFSTFSDEEIQMLLSRTKTIISALEKEIKKTPSKDVSKKVYRDKLLRYKKYFSYRHTILMHRCTGNVDLLKKQVIQDISSRGTPFRIECFFEKYSDDILASTISFALRRCTEENITSDDLYTAVEDLDKKLFEGVTNHSYFKMTYLEYTKNQIDCCPIDKYDSLINLVRKNYQSMRQLLYSKRIEMFNSSVVAECNSSNSYEKSPFKLLNLREIFNYSKYVRFNSNEMERMIINSIFSYVFEYEVSDTFTVSKVGHHSMQYCDLRILAMLRNSSFDINSFAELYQDYVQDEFRQDADYTLLQVMDIFRLFVGDAKRIDDLIRIHKYCCDTWKNGSKHLHFYTLHNQDHAVSLIRSSIRLLHAISYFELKQIDYFVLFAACYLHDISMVSLPDPNSFIIGDNQKANHIYSKFVEEFDPKDSTKSKKALYDAYYHIDGFFEQNIRGNHAYDSAQEIRTFKELDFIEPTMRELIANVSNGHGYDTADIYFRKSSGSSSLVNEKFVKILLRLSDLLDMSRYRISRVILAHNLKSLNDVSRFHWISHLITDGFDLTSQYYIRESNSNESSIRRGSIVEKVILKVNVLMSQTTEVDNSSRCKYIDTCTFNDAAKEGIRIELMCNKDSTCTNSKCNFLCKWFVLKNEYLLKEFASLKDYLNSITDNFYSSEFEIQIQVISNTNIPNDVFDYLREYVNCHTV